MASNFSENLTESPRYRYQSRIDDIVRIYADIHPAFPRHVVETAIFDTFFPWLRESLHNYDGQRYQARSQAEWNVTSSWCWERAWAIVGDLPPPMITLEQLESKGKDRACDFIEQTFLVFPQAQFENDPAVRTAFRQAYVQAISFDALCQQLSHFQALVLPTQTALPQSQSQTQHTNTSLGSVRRTFSSRSQSHAEATLESARQAAAAATQSNP